ncbi:MAG: hypothetical protein R6U27_01240 [Desulfobacterales bacterium]
MTEKKDFPNKTKTTQQSDGNEIIDLTEKAWDLSGSQINAIGSSKANKNEDIIELSEEVDKPYDNQNIIDLTQEISMPLEKESTSSNIFGNNKIDQKDISVSQQMIESAIERIIRKVLAEKIELIFMEALQKVVKEDIKKIKEHVLQQGKHDT